MDQAPWWFASVMPLVGVVIGVALKWATDAWSERARHRREDEARHLDQRREAYAELCRAASDVEWHRRVAAFTQMDMDASGHVLRSEQTQVEDKRAAVRLQQEMEAAALQRLSQAVDLIDMIGSRKASDAALRVRDACSHEDSIDMALARFYDTARTDLRSPPDMT